jgi:hypothetical protein
MNSRRASFIAACQFVFATVLFAIDPAAAQVQPQQPAAGSPWDQQPQPAPWPGQAPQSAQGLQGLPGMQGPQQGPSPQQQQQQACIEDFGKLRDIAQKRAMAIRTASERKAQAKEACGLFNAFSDAEVKMIKYAGDNAKKCGIPPEIVKTLTQNHGKTNEIRTRVCQAAAGGPAPSAAPSLSDALSAPVPDASNIKTGRGTGTYDTLTGTPLGK